MDTSTGQLSARELEFARDSDKFSSFIVTRRRREIVITRNFTPSGRPPIRSAITSFTGTAAMRLRRSIENSYCDFKVFITLTYPEQFPNDGAIVKGHWRAFCERLRRSGYFERASMIWFIEFQERGAPHFHVLASHWLAKSWVATAWAEITSGDAKSCSRVEGIRNPAAAGAYAAKYASKAEQKIVPDGFKNVGRFWGRAGYRPVFEDMPEWFKLARAHVYGQVGAPLRVRAPVCATPRVKKMIGKNGRISAVVAAAIRKSRLFTDPDGHFICIRGTEDDISRIWHDIDKTENAEAADNRRRPEDRV